MRVLVLPAMLLLVGCGIFEGARYCGWDGPCIEPGVYHRDPTAFLSGGNGGHVVYHLRHDTFFEIMNVDSLGDCQNYMSGFWKQDGARFTYEAGPKSFRGEGCNIEGKGTNRLSVEPKSIARTSMEWESAVWRKVDESYAGYSIRP